MSKGKRLPSLFSTTDEQFHAQLRRSVNSAFSMSALVQYEPLVDLITERFLDQTQNLFVSRNAPCDFAEWLQFYAFDVIGNITYSKPHGFVDRGEDVDGMVGYLGWLFSYVAPVSVAFTPSSSRACTQGASLFVPKLIYSCDQIGQIPFLDLLFLKNPILRLLEKYNLRNNTFAVVTFAQARMGERLAELKAAEEKGTDSTTALSRRADLLSMFLKAKADRPEFFHDGRVLVMAISMAFAGSETTGISLAAIFYFLVKHPACYQKLMEELDGAFDNGTVENRPSSLVSWAESQTLPYLDACIKEAFRLHPAAGLPLERIVPKEGMEICGEFIKGGTIVGCNAWVIHRRPEIFGEDVDVYRPERWIEADKEARSVMEGTLFQFGAGARTCIGKNVSLLEIYKVVPSFLRRFEVRTFSLHIPLITFMPSQPLFSAIIALFSDDPEIKCLGMLRFPMICAPPPLSRDLAAREVIQSTLGLEKSTHALGFLLISFSFYAGPLGNAWPGVEAAQCVVCQAAQLLHSLHATKSPGDDAEEGGFMSKRPIPPNSFFFFSSRPPTTPSSQLQLKPGSATFGLN